MTVLWAFVRQYACHSYSILQHVVLRCLLHGAIEVTILLTHCLIHGNSSSDLSDTERCVERRSLFNASIGAMLHHSVCTVSYFVTTFSI